VVFTVAIKIMGESVTRSSLLLYFCVLSFDIFCCFAEVMARCSPLDEAGGGMAEVENMDEAVIAVELERAFEENHAASNVEQRRAGSDGEDTLSEGGSGNENSRTCYFGSSTITVGKIKEMVEKGYFPEGGAHAGDENCVRAK
jgi:hypothetical protein